MIEQMMSIKHIYADIEKKEKEARLQISENSKGIQEIAALYEPERISLIKEAQSALKEHGFLWDTKNLSVIMVKFKPLSWRDHVFFVERHIGRCLTNVA